MGALSLILRVASLLALGGLVACTSILFEDPGLQTIFPWFALLIYLQLAPSTWATRPGLFRPPVVTGLIAAFGTLAMLVGVIQAGAVHTPFVELNDPDTSLALGVVAVQAMIFGLVSYYLGFYARW